MSALATTGPDRELQHEADSWIGLAEALKVVDALSYEIAGTHLHAIKALQGEADATFDPIISKAHQAHAEALKQKRRITDPLTRAESLLKRNMGSYIQEQQRKQREEERRLREEAERVAAEAREVEIEEAEATGATTEEVAAIIQAPLRVAPVVTAPATPRMQGISSRENWKAEVTNLLALIKFVAANPQFANLLQPNTVAIGGMARSMRSAMNIPGIKVWSESNIAAKRS